MADHADTATAARDAATPAEGTHDPAGGLPTDGLAALLDGDTANVRERVRAFLVDQGITAQHGLPVAEHRDLVRAWLRAATDQGVFGDGLPPLAGGDGDRVAATAAFETFAHGDGSLLIKLGVHHGLWGGAITNLGTERHADLVATIGDLSLPGCFAMTERAHGSDVAGLATTATYDPAADEFVVTTPDPDTDFKEWIGNAAEDARMAAVFAKLVVDGVDHGVHCLVVELRDEHGTVRPGIRITDCGHKLGLNGVDNGRIWFDEVRVPRTNLLNRFGDVTADGDYTSPIESRDRRFFTTLGTLVQGRVSIAGAALGATKSGLTIAVRHALRRTQFSGPGGTPVTLMDYPIHRRRLLVPLARTYGLHAAQVVLARDLHDAFESDDPQRRRMLESHAAVMKVAATEHATATIQECREACGGLGYLTENRIAALKADTDVFTTFEGDNTVLAQLVAKALLSSFRDEFNAMDWTETLGHVTSLVAGSVVEATSVRTLFQRVRDLVDRDAGPDVGVRNRDWQLSMMLWRERHMLTSLARRLQQAGPDEHEQFAAFQACQPHMVALARAHADRRVMEAFAAMVEGADDDLGATLNTACDLSALATVERHRGWFQEHNRLSGARSKAITRTIDELCAELAPIAGDLVDAFRIPDDVLAAPMAT